MIRLSRGVAALGLSSVVCRCSTVHCSEMSSLLVAEAIQDYRIRVPETNKPSPAHTVPP